MYLLSKIKILCHDTTPRISHNDIIMSFMFIICLVYLSLLYSSPSFTIVRSSFVLLSTIHYFVIIVNHVLRHTPHYDITILTCSLSQLHIIVSTPFINKYRNNIYYIISTSGQSFICGDFNINLLKIFTKPNYNTFFKSMLARGFSLKSHCQLEYVILIVYL